jgi:hypothetical protein
MIYRVNDFWLSLERYGELGRDKQFSLFQRLQCVCSFTKSLDPTTLQVINVTFESRHTSWDKLTLWIPPHFMGYTNPLNHTTLQGIKLPFEFHHTSGGKLTLWIPPHFRDKLTLWILQHFRWYTFRLWSCKEKVSRKKPHLLFGVTIKRSDFKKFKLFNISISVDYYYFVLVLLPLISI